VRKEEKIEIERWVVGLGGEGGSWGPSESPPGLEVFGMRSRGL